MEDRADGVADLLCAGRRPVGLNGEGTSTESGIPDLGSPVGIWNRFDPSRFTCETSETPQDHRAHVVIPGPSAAVLAGIAARGSRRLAPR